MRENTTIDRDLGEKALLRQLGQARNSFADAGYWGAAKHPDGEDTIPNIAAKNEYGAGRTPERSFIGSTVDENLRKYERKRDELLSAMLAGKTTIEAALTALAEYGISDIRAKITKGDPNWPALADATIDARRRRHPTSPKGGERPLFDTGYLAKSGGTRVFINGRKVADDGGK